MSTGGTFRVVAQAKLVIERITWTPGMDHVRVESAFKSAKDALARVGFTLEKWSVTDVERVDKEVSE